MKKYIVSLLVSSIFLVGAPFAVQQTSASDMSIRDFINLLIVIGVIPADKVPAVNAYLATLDNTTPPTDERTLYFSTTFVGYSYTIGDIIPSDYSHQQIILTNGSKSNIDIKISVKNQPSWLNTAYSTDTFTTNPGQPFGIGVSVNPAGLSAGTYKTNIKISGNFDNSPRTIPVTLNIFDNEEQQKLLITSVQSPAEDPNILHPGERATIYGDNLDADNIYVYITGKAWDQTISTYNPHYGSIDFTVPYIPEAGNYYLSLKQSNRESNELRVNIVSPVVAQPSISVISPNGGETYQTGDTVPIRFNLKNLSERQTPNGVTLQLYRAQRGSPEYIGDIVKNYITGYIYNWTIPNNLNPDLYYLYAAAPVTGISLPEGGVSDFSDNYFTISAPTIAQPSITITSPNGGENLKFGDSLNISWSTTGISNGRVGVYLMNTNNLACSIGSAEATAERYTITLKENQVCPGNPYFTALEAGRYKVYIDAAPATGLEDLGDSSDGYFAITAPIIAEPSITSPNGGERIVQGQMLNVFWDSASPTQAVGISIVSSTGGIMQNFVQGVTPAGADYQSLGFTTSASTSSNRYIPVGQYKASVCSVASHQCNNSDNYFSIVAATN